MNLGEPIPEVNGLGEARTVNGEYRTIPYDYAFRYELEGQLGKVHNDTVTVSIEAPFTAVSIGYGVVPKVAPLRFGITPGQETCVHFAGFLPPGQGEGQFSNPFRVPPASFEVRGFEGNLLPGTAIRGGAFAGLDCERQLEITLDVVCAQVELAMVHFNPRAASVRAFNRDGTLAGSASLTPDQRVTQTVKLQGTAINRLLVTAPQSEVFLQRFCFEPQEVPLRAITLGEILDGLDRTFAGTSLTLSGETAPEATLKNGLRLNPDLAEAVLTGANDPAPPLALSVLGNLFQVVGTSSDQIAFLYSLIDDGTGREFQSQPILNTAGLGKADGRRPFRYFARPIEFSPRSTIRMQVTEKSGFRGELHVSLQGYKTLGAPGTPTGRRQARRFRSTTR